MSMIDEPETSAGIRVGDLPNADQLPPVELPAVEWSDPPPPEEPAQPLQITIRPPGQTFADADDPYDLIADSEEAQELKQFTNIGAQAFSRTDTHVDPETGDEVTYGVVSLESGREVRIPAARKSSQQRVTEQQQVADPRQQFIQHPMGTAFGKLVDASVEARGDIGKAVLTGIGKGAANTAKGLLEIITGPNASLVPDPFKLMYDGLVSIQESLIGDRSQIEGGIRKLFETVAPDLTDWLEEPYDNQTLGNLVQSLSQFATPAVAAAAGIKAISSANAFVRSLGWGGIADYFAFDPMTPTATQSLIEAFEHQDPEQRWAVSKAAINILGKQESQNILNRLRMVPEGALLGVAFEGVIRSPQGARAAAEFTRSAAEIVRRKMADIGMAAEGRMAERSVARGSTLNMGVDPGEIVDPALKLMGQAVSTPPELPRATDLDALGFYSAALRAAQEMPQKKGTPAQMRAALLKVAGVKEEELVWTGLDDLLDRRMAEGKKARITKHKRIEHLENNRVEIEEIEGVKVERGGREDYEVQEGTVPTAWSSEVVEDWDYLSSRADDMRSELDFYWDQISDKVSPRSVRGKVLAELGITPGSDQGLYIRIPHAAQLKVDGAVDVPLSEIEFLRAVRDLKDLGVISDEVADDAAWDGVLQRIADDGDADDALYDIAKAEYDENPLKQYFDDSGHGYVITGNDDAGFTLKTPGGETSTHMELSEAQDRAIEHSYESELVEYDAHGGEFAPEYMGYTMAGSESENYRELLFKFPTPTGPYRGGHFSDEFAEGFTSRDLEAVTESDLISPENVGAHVRVSDINIKGEKVLALDEAQSDLHKKQRLPGGGYGPPTYRRSTAKEEAKLKEADESIKKMFHSASELSDQQRVEASPLFQTLIKDLKATPDDTRVVSTSMVRTAAQRSEEAIYTDIADLLGIRDLLPDVLDGNMPGPTTTRGMLTESSPFYAALRNEYAGQFGVEHVLLPPSVTNALDTFSPISIPAQQALDGGQGISDTTEEMIRNYNAFAYELQAKRGGGALWSPIGINAHQAISDALLKRENISDHLLTKMNPTNAALRATMGDVPVLSPEGNKLLFQYRSAVGARNDLKKRIDEIQGSQRPDMPFKSMDERGWPQLVMRRLVRYAVENDYDRIAWSPGVVQKARYNAPRDLYDKTIPKVVNKIIKKFDPAMKIDDGVASGIQVGDIPLPNIKITSKMRDSIKRLGQAIFTLTGGVGLAEMTQDQEQTQ
jgi:hypothetical protein